MFAISWQPNKYQLMDHMVEFRLSGKKTIVGSSEKFVSVFLINHRYHVTGIRTLLYLQKLERPMWCIYGRVLSYLTPNLFQSLSLGSINSEWVDRSTLAGVDQITAIISISISIPALLPRYHITWIGYTSLTHQLVVYRVTLLLCHSQRVLCSSLVSRLTPLLPIYTPHSFFFLYKNHFIASIFN